MYNLLIFSALFHGCLTRDIVATNGVIHVVDDVLLLDYAKPGLLDSVRSKSKFLADMIEKSGTRVSVQNAMKCQPMSFGGEKN
jgi:hypothetical protein